MQQIFQIFNFKIISKKMLEKVIKIINAIKNKNIAIEIAIITAIKIGK